MDKKQILLTVFILVAIVQLAVPAKMIWNRERILETGKVFKFETAPIDPTDPFRGKYIVLRYKESTVQVNSGYTWKNGDNIYVLLKTDAKGFAKIASISNKKPEDDLDFVKAKVEFVTDYPSKNLTIAYPFDRFYMEESKAADAERLYIETQVDSTKSTYALVKISDGDAVLQNVMIEGIPIREVVERGRAEDW